MHIFDGGSLDREVLTGFLADGTAINNQLWMYDSAKVTLAAPGAVLPKPSSIPMLARGATILGSMSFRRR